MVQFIRTYNEGYLQRHRDAHARHPTFGTHLHPYLHDTMRQLAMAVCAGPDPLPSLLDYGCGKGAFMAKMASLSLFRPVRPVRPVRGCDPGVTLYKQRPLQRYDVVTCLDVLDHLENAFVDSAIKDVAQFTGRFAVFSVITRQTPKFEHLNPRSAATWREMIEPHMRVSDMTVRPSPQEEIDQGACPERVIITAEPLGVA